MVDGIKTLTPGDGVIPIDPQEVNHLQVGAAWDDSTAMQGRVSGFLNRKRGADLDLIVVAFQNNNPVRYAGFDNNDPLGNASLLHSGDAKTGRASGDDESVDIRFNDFPAVMNIHKLVCFVSAFKRGKSFDQAANILFTIYDRSGDGNAVPVANIMPALNQTGNAHRICTVERTATGWGLKVDDVRGTITQGDVQSLYQYACR